MKKFPILVPHFDFVQKKIISHTILLIWYLMKVWNNSLQDEILIFSLYQLKNKNGIINREQDRLNCVREKISNRFYKSPFPRTMQLGFPSFIYTTCSRYPWIWVSHPIIFYVSNQLREWKEKKKVLRDMH